MKTVLKNWRDHHRTGIRKLNRNILMVTVVFLNQKRVNVCEHTTKMASLISFQISLHPSLSQPPLVAPFIKSLVTPSLLCSHTFTLFWLRKTAMPVKIFRLSFCVFFVPVLQWSLQYLIRVFTFLSLILCYSYFGTFPSTWSTLNINHSRGHFPILLVMYCRTIYDDASA